MKHADPGGCRVAFFGGSFDPPHLGHLAVARAAREALGLDTVLFAPVGTQPLKAQGSTASYEDRLAMTRLAIAREPGFEVSLADAPKPHGSPNYTLETLRGLHAELGPECTLFFLMGADSFFGLRKWHRAAEIPFAADLIVASRPGQPLEDFEAALPPELTIEAATGRNLTLVDLEVRRFLLRNRAGDQAKFYLLPGLDVEISASEIRAQIRDRDREAAQDPQTASPPARLLLPDSVSAYVRNHGLYR